MPAKVNIARCREILHDLSNKVGALELAERAGKDDIMHRAVMVIRTRLREMDELVSVIVPVLAQGTEKIAVVVPAPPENPAYDSDPVSGE